MDLQKKPLLDKASVLDIIERTEFTSKADYRQIPLAPPDRSGLHFTSLYQGGNTRKTPLLDKGGGRGWICQKKPPPKRRAFL
ncbi:MAG: hypothetical protein DLD55_05085 [candidate division SR1 bacterium]|nr:MAG: hypothetical protein DLD55_05085 [candidate division SR1 bacterium]